MGRNHANVNLLRLSMYVAVYVASAVRLAQRLNNPDLHRHDIIIDLSKTACFHESEMFMCAVLRNTRDNPLQFINFVISVGNVVAMCRALICLPLHKVWLDRSLPNCTYSPLGPFTDCAHVYSLHQSVSLTFDMHHLCQHTLTVK